MLVHLHCFALYAASIDYKSRSSLVKWRVVHIYACNDSQIYHNIRSRHYRKDIEFEMEFYNFSIKKQEWIWHVDNNVVWIKGRGILVFWSRRIMRMRVCLPGMLQIGDKTRKAATRGGAKLLKNFTSFAFNIGMGFSSIFT